MEQKEFSFENNENCEKLLDNNSTPSSAHLESKLINEYLNSFDGSEGNTSKHNSTLKSNNSIANVDSTVSRDNTSQEESKKLNYDRKIENTRNNKIFIVKIAERKNSSDNKNIHDIMNEVKKDELTIKSKNNEEIYLEQTIILRKKSEKYSKSLKITLIIVRKRLFLLWM